LTGARSFVFGGARRQRWRFVVFGGARRRRWRFVVFGGASSSSVARVAGGEPFGGEPLPSARFHRGARLRC
jgi:hypothetical protein